MLAWLQLLAVADERDDLAQRIRFLEKQVVAMRREAQRWDRPLPRLRA